MLSTRKIVCAVLIMFLVNATLFGFSPEVLADSALHQDEITSLAGLNVGSDSANSDKSQGEQCAITGVMLSAICKGKSVTSSVFFLPIRTCWSS
jgi:hypothetical protein